MDKRDVIEFFDAQAPHWDADMVRSDEIINTILDNAGAGRGQKILDVACGTGVMIPDYLRRGAASVTGIDISPEMIKRAEEKFLHSSVRFICGDVECTDVGDGFDVIMVYNAFPHFPEPARLVEHLSGLLTRGGTLTVAHGMSREKIDHHHSNTASKVSVGLMSAEELAAIFGRYLEVTVQISDDRMYQVTGKRTEY